MNILSILLTSLVSLAVLFLLCKANGQRQLSQMTMFDYINSITIGSIAAELATELEAWQEPLTAMLVYGVAAIAINQLTCKSIQARRFFSGRPLILMENGKLDRRNLARSAIDLNEFLTQCRVAGYFDLTQLQAVILEPNGQFSFLPQPEARPATPQDLGLTPPTEPLWYSLIVDGKLLPENLHCSGRDEIWLSKQLEALGIRHVEDAFLAVCDGNGKFFASARTAAPAQKDIFE